MTNQLTERTLNKVDVAKTQLDAAIQAYGKGEDVIAVTLAGAAEEILGLCAVVRKLKMLLRRLLNCQLYLPFLTMYRKESTF
jgi:hypothetical protein